MEQGAVKCVLIVADDLPPGLAVNTATVLGITLGRRIETILGSDVPDTAGQLHTGLTWLPIPILAAKSAAIKQLREQAALSEDLLVVDVTDAAQESRTYQDYQQRLGTVPADDLAYLGMALYGQKKHINALTGRLPLFGSTVEDQSATAAAG